MSDRYGETAAQALTLKVLNTCLARYEFEARSTALNARPVGLVVDPSNMCQLACPGCVHSERAETFKIFDWPKGTLSHDRLSSLLTRYAPHAVAVYFYNYGEPLLNLNTPKLIGLAKRYLVTTLISTSLSVKRFDPDAYVASGLDFMVISIDGATQEIYGRYRRNGDLELVLHNLRELVAARKRLGRRLPVLSWNFLAFEHNVHQIPQAMRMARSIGLDQFRVVAPFDVSWDDPSIRLTPVKAGVHRLQWTSAVNPPVNWNPFPDDLAAGPIAAAFEQPVPAVPADGRATTGHTCQWLYKNMVMDANGRIMPCCGGPAPERNLVFGRYPEDGGDPFNSDLYRSARAFFNGDERSSAISPHCARCEWDHSVVNIGGPEIRRYFRGADPAFF